MSEDINKYIAHLERLAKTLKSAEDEKHQLSDFYRGMLCERESTILELKELISE